MIKLDLSCSLITIESQNDSSFFPPALVKEFLTYIHKTSAKKAMGSDTIPTIVVKNCALVLAPCLASIADLILSHGNFPEAWKTAIVIPVPKVPASSSPSDCPPISLLPIMN